ncbi:MAG TPA: N-acetylglucosamine-6-phosphate deacetylase [Terriglobales bacterium]|jgi:N-acetylglucosamine-6-phosphate deacetylase
MIALTASALLTPRDRIEDPILLIDDGLIADVKSRTSAEIPKNARVLDFSEGVIVPGLVDLHNHGGAGHDVMESDSSALTAIESHLLVHGVTGYLPTTVTAPIEKTCAALQRLADAVESAAKQGYSASRAKPLGIHIEGPFLSPLRRGVHPPKDLLVPTMGTFNKLWDAARGHIRLMTIAPELDGAMEIIVEAVKRGITVSIGHSDADLQTARTAIDAGARHATHTFNAMRPFLHRDPGIIGEVLTDSRMTADIIADGVHSDPSVVKLFLRAKGPEGAVLITDSTAATGMPEGHYSMGDFEFDVKDGKCMANGVLAGSVLTLDQAVRNCMQFAGWNLQNALTAATTNPARVARLQNRGSLMAGAVADLVVMDSAGRVLKAIVSGQIA